MEKLKISRAVRILIENYDNDRTLDSLDLSDKEERYYLHRELGKLTNFDVLCVSKRRVASNSDLQKMISAWEVDKLVAYGFLERVTDNSRKYELKIRFNDDGEVAEAVFIDESKGNCIAFAATEIYERAAVKALVAYSKYLRG